MAVMSGVYLSISFCADVIGKLLWRYVDSRQWSLMLVVGWLGKELWVWMPSMRILYNRKRDGHKQLEERHILGSSRGVANVGRCCRCR